MLPNFLIIGAFKTGTTSLHRYLREHPQVFMAEDKTYYKELRFFVGERRGGRGLAWYEQQFEGAENAIAIAEASHQYSLYPVFRWVPPRIAQLLPNVRLIYLVRHPIERMRSDYVHRLAYGGEKNPIRRALLTNPVYLNGSRYALQIEQYLEYFPRERLLVVPSEDLRDDRARTMRRILEFLGADSSWHGTVLQEEFNKTAEMYAFRPFARRLWNTPTHNVVKWLTPKWLRMLVGPFVAHKAYRRAWIPEDLRRQLGLMLYEDVVRLSRYMDDSFDIRRYT